MENTMVKSLGLSTALLSIVLLICAGSVSARTGDTFVPIPGSAIQINAVTSAINQPQILTFLASEIYTGGGDGYQDTTRIKTKIKIKTMTKITIKISMGRAQLPSRPQYCRSGPPC
jgi:hypothetical protein